MPTYIIMDQRGDSRHFFEAADGRALAGAEARFNELTGKGYRAVVPGDHGQPGRLVTGFDPSMKEIVFIPPLEGG
jgi:hypothetical protein